MGNRGIKLLNFYTKIIDILLPITLLVFRKTESKSFSFQEELSPK